jgi:toxin ParE1/3/4
MRVVIRESAYADIERIHTYLAANASAFVAASALARIMAAIERLGDFPRMGHFGREPGTLEWVVRNLPYIIVYETDPVANVLTVLAVFHGRQRRR